MAGADPIRVVVLIDSLLAGGAERVAVDLACELDRSRFAPELVVGRHGGPLQEIAEAHGVPVTILGRSHRLDPRGLATALRHVRHADVLHAHKLAGALLGAGLARIAGTPLIAHEHTFDGRRTRERTLGYRWWIGPAAARIVCVSEFVAQSLREEGVPATRLEVIPNGIRTESALDRAAARAELGLDESAVVVGMVGRLRPEKRHELALDAVARLRARGREVLLCVVGDGPLRASLEERARALGLDGAVVRWAGERPSAGRLARAFDVTIMCSRFEGMPLAAIESLVAGVPVVATAVGGLPELVRPGTGLLVPPDDAEALAVAIDRLLGDPAALVDPLAFASLRERHDLRAIVARWEQLYEGIAGS